MTRTRRLAGNLSLLLFGTAFGLLVLEIGARLVIRSRRPGGTGEQALYTMGDPILGWRNRPGATLKYNRREYQTTVTINSLGFRDVDRSLKKPPERQRIIVLGDSFVEAYAVELDQGLTRRIEAIANEDGCPVDVVNAGVHAYSIDQEFLWYERESAPLEPDVVIMAVYYNDIINTLRGNYWGSLKPVLESRDGRLVPVNTPLPPMPEPDVAALTAPKPPRPVAGSALRQLVIERLLAGAPRYYARLAAVGLVDPLAPDDVADELRVYKSHGQLEEVERSWQRTGEIVNAFAKTARGRGTTPVLAYIPARFEVNDGDWELTRLRFAMNPTAWDRSLVARNLERAALEAGLPFLDFTEALRASTGVLTGSPYFEYDGHWNARGNNIAAQSTVAFLRAQRLLSCGKR